ncbi:hypothetical protein McanCB56680_004895 [Microsporum canis]
MQFTVVHPMPRPGTVGAPYFDGRNTTKFLESFKRTCASYRITASKALVEHLYDYTEDSLLDVIEGMTGYINQDWELLYREIKLEFKRADMHQALDSRGYLEYLKNKGVSGD